MAEAKKDNLVHDGILLKNFPGYFLIACVLLCLIGVITIFLPFIGAIILAAVAAVSFYPVYERVFKAVKGRAKLASLLSCLLVAVLIIVPLSIFLLLLWQQTKEIFMYIQQALQNGQVDWLIKWEKGGWLYDSLGNLRDQFRFLVDFDPNNFKRALSDAVSPVSATIALTGAKVLKEIGWFLLDVFVFFFALYYFFKDSDLILKKLMLISPLPYEHEKKLIEKFREISLATLYGIFLTAVVQGIAAGIGYTIAGIPHNIFWATATGLFSLVPMIGTATIWLPTSIIWLAAGHIWEGLFIFFWGLLVVSTVDNFMRTWLIGSKTRTNQLLTFLAVFGGLLLFGLVGVIYGPLILNIFFTLLHIYEIEYATILHRKK
ncbi:AI-2E family transporter [Candidatus Gracilibacteria bacterium]|nr:AI-2E family transporter [Candidatus Gracilibacteria bacterium]